jgi:hypothetical protein
LIKVKGIKPVGFLNALLNVDLELKPTANAIINIDSLLIRFLNTKVIYKMKKLGVVYLSH